MGNKQEEDHQRQKINNIPRIQGAAAKAPVVKVHSNHFNNVIQPALERTDFTNGGKATV